MATLSIVQGDMRKYVTVMPGITVLEGLRTGGFLHVEAPCGGSGRCGRCLAKITGEVSPISPRERALLTPGDERRLMCLTVIQGDCTVELGQGSLTAAEEGLSRFVSQGGGTGLGAAVDIGTTTVVLHLCSRATGETLATVSAGNAQRSFGADVIARVQHAMEHPDGLAAQTAAIRTQLAELLARACRQANRSPSEVEEVYVAGNTVMEHLFAGLSPAGIAVAPFTPASLFGNTVPAEIFGLGTSPDATLTLAPCVSGYVGGDITAGLMAVDAAHSEQPVLFVDVGTNGEMALGDQTGLLCCSTAAGPAFEGACISCGMAAVPGAIDKVWLENDQICCSVLGGGQALGLCGSGLLDALAVLLKLEIVDETGRLLPADEAPAQFADRLEGEGRFVRFHLTEHVWVSAEDVRRLQLAKAAIAAGIETLMEEKGLTAADISVFYLAGGFGSFLRPESAAAIGLFPSDLLPKLHVVGNSAGAGARAALLSKEARHALTATQGLCEYLELSGLAQFNDAYLDHMIFE